MNTSVSYTHPIMMTNNFSENIVLLRYWKSKKIFNKKNQNIILRKKFNTLFQISNNRIVKVNKRVVFQNSTSFFYNKKQKNKLTSYVLRRVNVLYPGMRKHQNLNPYITHPFFINFENDLLRSFWTFLGTPLFELYFPRVSNSMLEDPETYFPKNESAIKEFYMTDLTKSKKKYNINFLLQTLAKLDHSNTDTGLTDSEAGEDLSHSISDGDDDSSLFRIFYEDEGVTDNNAEDMVDEAAPLVEVGLDMPYLFLKTIHNSSINFEIDDFTSYFLLDFVSDYVDSEFDFEHGTTANPTIRKYKNSKTTKKRFKRNKNTKQYYKTIYQRNVLNLFKNNTCREFFVNLNVYKNFKNNKFKGLISLHITPDLDFDYEETFLANRNLNNLELLIDKYKYLNYLNLKYKYLINTASRKSYNMIKYSTSNIDTNKYFTGTILLRNELRAKKLKYFKKLIKRMRLQLLSIERLVTKNLNRQLFGPERVNKNQRKNIRKDLKKFTARRLFNILIRRFITKTKIKPKIRHLKRLRLSDILNVNNRRLVSSMLKIRPNTSLKKKTNINLITNTLMRTNILKQSRFVMLSMLNLKPKRIRTTYSGYNLIRKPTNTGSRSRNIVRKSRLKSSKLKTLLTLGNRLTRGRYSLFVKLYLLKNQILSKTTTSVGRNLTEPSYLVNLKYFNKLPNNSLSDYYLDSNTELLTTVSGQLIENLNTPTYFKNFNTKFITKLNTENYFKNFFIQKKDLSSVSSLNIGTSNPSQPAKFAINDASVLWLLNQVNFYSRTSFKLNQDRLIYSKYKSILGITTNDKSLSTKFFTTVLKMFLSTFITSSSEFNRSETQDTIRPFFGTKFNNAFVLGVYGFYFRTLIDERGFVTTSKVHTYLHSLYSFSDSLSLKKNMLKGFLLKKEYQIDENAFEDYYDTFGFNFFMINNTLSHNKPSLLYNHLRVKQFNTVDYPFNNEAEEYEIEPDKSLRIKFKPGYSIIWRRVRTLFKEVFYLKFKYQHRLTTHLFKYENNIFKQKLYYKTDNTILLMLIRNKFAFDLSWSSELLDNNYVFINSYLVTNPQTTLIKGDFVQLIVHIKYYTVLKWRHGVSILQKTRAYKFAKRKFRPKDIRDGADRNYNYPSWLLKLRFYEGEVPSYVEIDFFTLSFFVIYNPFVELHRLPYLEYIPLPKVVRLYNWKYIN